MPSVSRLPLLVAGLSGTTGVGLGAFGAHALRTMLTEMGTRDRWETAVFYQLIHTVALFSAAVWLNSAEGERTRAIVWATRFWTAGIVLFSGALYVMSVNTSMPAWFKIPVPPLGGTCFVLGWLCVFVAAFSKKA